MWALKQEERRREVLSTERCILMQTLGKAWPSAPRPLTAGVAHAAREQPVQGHRLSHSWLHIWVNWGAFKKSRMLQKF